MQMYYKSCVHSWTIRVHELLCCINGYAMRIEGKKFEFEDTIAWVFVMHSSVEMVTKRLYLQIGAQKKARFFSLMYFCESLCINRISHNYVIPQFLFCTSFHIPFRKLIPPLTLTDVFVGHQPPSYHYRLISSFHILPIGKKTRTFYDFFLSFGYQLCSQDQRFFRPN